MQVGEYEVLLSDKMQVSEKAKKSGVKVRTSVYAGMFHVFQMGLDLIPESREAWEEAGEFLRIIYGIQRKDDGKPVKKVKNRRPEAEARARELLKAMIRGELSGGGKEQGGEER